MTSVLEAKVSAPNKEYEKILVGYDGSENAKRALRRAVELTKRSGGDLAIVVAADTAGSAIYAMGQYYAPFREDMVKHAKNLLAEASDTAKQARIKAYGTVEEGRPADMILAKAVESKADLIVVGRRGIRGIQRFLMGSVSSSVVSHSECDVLVVK